MKKSIDTSDPILIAAVQATFGPIAVDLAAQAENHVVKRYISKETNSLDVDWAEILDGGIGWLNPPAMDDLVDWSKKCVEEAAKGAKILLFTEAAIDTAAFWAHLYPHSAICVLHPRISYDYRVVPTMIAAFNCGYAHGSMNLWLWESNQMVERVGIKC